MSKEISDSAQNCKVGQRYPMAPGVVPAQSKAIFKTVDHAAGEFLSPPKVTDWKERNRIVDDLNDRLKKAWKGKNCPKGGFCEPGGGHGSIEWCEKCNNII